MLKTMTLRARMMAGWLSAAALAALMLATPSFADQQFIPGIWVDPDGCEHWVMDDGEEGYMSPHRTRDGRPVCRRTDICGIMPADQLFASNQHAISAHNRERLEQFFREADAYGFLIYGHTDNRASDEYNMGLSNRRANAVAEVARSIGARVVDVRGFGERQPIAPNDTSQAGMAQNRRVEIYCLR